MTLIIDDLMTTLAQSSLLTGKVQSLLQLPAHTPSASVSVFYDYRGAILEVMVSPDVHSVSTVMLLAIRKLNEEKGLKLLENAEHYELYAAKKNGTRKSDLPAIEHEQELAKTGYKRFCLCPCWKAPLLETKESLSSIKTQITDGGQRFKESGDVRAPVMSRSQRFFQCLCIGKQ